MLLYDMLVDAVKKQHEKDEMLKNIPVFLVDNVARYWAECGKDKYESSDYPNVAPPYEIFFMEYAYPKKMNINGEMQMSYSNIDRLGTVFIAHEQQELPFNARWEMEFYTFITHKGKLFPKDEASVVGKFFIRGDGSLCDDVKVQLGISQLVGREVGGSIYESMVPMFLAISFLHCKNVTITTPGIPAPLAKKARKKRGIVPVRYHVLEIEPLKKILRREGNSEITGLKHALHICRGHFKDYSQGAGLFGKYKGLYWWDSQLRGSVEEGVVVKDYKVNPPD